MWIRTANALVFAICFLCLGFGSSAPAQTAEADRSADDEADREESGSTLIPFPIYFYTPETESGFGAALLYYFRSSAGKDRPSSISPLVIYTTKKQISALLAAELYFDDGRYRLSGKLSGSKFPNTFWGVGNNAPEEAEEDYTPRTFSGEVRLQRELAPRLYLGPRVWYAYRSLEKVEAGRLLDSRAIPGTGDGRVISAGGVVTWDSRDSNVYPRSGDYHEFGASLYDGLIASEYEYAEFTLDLRRYLTVKGEQILALRLSALGVTATPPFDLLPQIGGDTLLRGYYQGRYRDRYLVAAQAEFRTPLWRRIGAVLFAGAGQVAHRMDEFRADGTRASGGAGLRFLLARDEGLNLRADFGFGEDSSGFYLGMGEVF